MPDDPYVGRFSLDVVRRILAAAAPIPVDELESLDPETGEVRRFRRAELVIRHLGWIDTWTQMSLQHQSDLSPSELVKRFHAIEAAARQLIAALGTGADGEFGSMQRQVRNGLRWVAEKYGERIGGFPHHPPMNWMPRNFDRAMTDFHGDSQLQDDIAAVARLRDWARDCETASRARVGLDSPDDRVSVELGIEPWLGDPLNDAIKGILKIWKNILGRPIRTSVVDGVGTGPLVSFVAACLDALRLREGREKPLESDALRARIRRAASADKPDLEES
jgi:hypothetical protein